MSRPALPTSFAALSVPGYRNWLGSQVVATTGIWMQRIAQDWLVLELTGSVGAVGIAVACQFVPVLLMGMLGGVLADRYPKRLLLIITQSSAALLALALGLLALSGQVQVWQVYLVAVLLGLVTAVDNPTRQVFVAELVGDRYIGNAISLNSSVFQLGALAGPALAGLLINAVGLGWCFLINSMACALVVIMVSRLHPSGSTPATPGKASPLGALREGLQVIKQTPRIAWTIALTAAFGVLGLNMPVILTSFAEHEFGTGVAGYSLYTTAGAVGALAGALLSARRTEAPRLRSLVWLLAAEGAVLAIAASVPTSATLCLIQVASGLVTLLYLTGANALVQTTAVAAVRGRVMSVYLLVLLGGQSVGSPAVGRLVDHFGARPALLVCGGAIVLAALACGAAIAYTREPAAHRQALAR